MQKNTSQVKLIFVLGAIISSAFLILTIVQLLPYHPPLGTDYLMMFWPIAELIVNSESASDFIRNIFADFHGEDHLRPIASLVGTLPYLLVDDPVIGLQSLAIPIFLLNLLSGLYLCWGYWRDWLRVTIFFILFSFDITLTSFVILGSLFGLETLWALWALISFNKYTDSRKLLHLGLFLLFFLLAILTYEAGFILAPFVFIYFLAESVGPSWRTRVRSFEFVLISSVICLGLIVYFVLHSVIYGTLLPGSRLPGAVVTSPINAIRYFGHNLVNLINTWTFGIPVNAKHALDSTDSNSAPAWLRLVFVPIGFIWLIFVMRFRLISRRGVSIATALVAVVVAILYTGRQGYGLWFSAGVIYLLLLTDMLSNTYQWVIKRFDKIPDGVTLYSGISVLIVALLTANLLNPISQHNAINKFWRLNNEWREAAYLAIGEGANKIVFVQLANFSSAKSLYNPLDFWHGNKMYNGEPALNHYPNHNAMHGRDLYIETYLNEKNLNFDFWRRYLTLGVVTEKAVVFEADDMFFRVMGGKDGHVLRVAPGLAEGKQSYALHYPNYWEYCSTVSGLELRLSGADFSGGIETIHYGGVEILEWRHQDEVIRIFVNDVRLDNELVVRFNDLNQRLHLIEVKVIGDDCYFPPQEAKLQNNNIVLATDLAACHYWTQRPRSLTHSGSIRGTLDPNQTLIINPLLPFDQEDVMLSTESLHPNTNFRLSEARSIRFDDHSTKYDKDAPINICAQRE